MKNTSFRRSLARNLHTLAYWIDPKAKKKYKAVPKQPEFYGKGMTEIVAEQQKRADLLNKLNVVEDPNFTIKPINPPDNVENKGDSVSSGVEPTDRKENEPSVAVVQEEQQATV